MQALRRHWRDHMQDVMQIATPETLEQLADAHAGQGDEFTAKAFRAMASAWRATERELHSVQAENSRLQHTLQDAYSKAALAEAMATSTRNFLASTGKVKV